MISERARGFNNTLFIFQALVVAFAFGSAMAVAFSFFTGASALHLEHYPAYVGILLFGLGLEVAGRSDRTIIENPLQRNFLDQHRMTVRQTVFTGGALLLYLAATKDAFISRTVLGIFLPVLYLGLFWSNRSLPRLIARRFFGGAYKERALLIGSPTKANEMRRWLCNKAALGFEAVGILSDDSDPECVAGMPRLGALADIDRVLAEYQITEAILLGLPENAAAHEKLVDVLDDRGVRILILSDLEERLRHPVVHIDDDGLSFVTTRQEPLENPLNRLAKRILDVTVALPTVVFILQPITVLVWLFQRWQSPGPVFFRQVRAGFQNRPFEIVKFRTMHVNNPDAARQATQDDPRIYPAGRWLRRLSIDELPQFWNVLKGDMSLVGPRPHLVVHNEIFAKQMGKYHVRALVKPGITGLAQLRGFRGEVRSADDIQSRVESDIAYLEGWRLTLDILIIFRTALQIVFLLANTLLLRKARPAPGQQRKEVGYTRGERLGGSTEAGYESQALRRNYRQILGIRFFTGSAAEAVALGMQGGLVVAPAAPALISLAENPVHRAAIASSDLAITDSGLMVLLWKLITGERITRVSGLEYLRLLLDQPQLRKPGATFWIMPNAASMERNLAWLRSQGFQVGEEDCYVAPNYGNEFDQIIDTAQLEIIRKKQPAHIIMAIGGGVQERLGAELRRNLSYRPSIYCLGAAIGFLSGDQVRIPMWADQCRLGWLFRCFSKPSRFFPRYWEARKLWGIMLEHQGRLPVAIPATKTDLEPSQPTHKA